MLHLYLYPQPHVTKSSPLCSSSLDDESINPPGSSSNKVQVQMPTERCTPHGCDQDGCTGVLLPAGEKSARRQPQAPVLLESSRAHLRSRFRGQVSFSFLSVINCPLLFAKVELMPAHSSVAAFLEVVSRVVTSKAQMEELVKSMLEHGMIDRAFAHSMARLCRGLAGMVTSDGTRFRKLLLDQLQVNRDVTQHSNVERWLGFVTLLSEVFGAMRSSDGEPFQVLILPIYTCLQEACRSFFATKSWVCSGFQKELATLTNPGLE
uniref:Uncharacterized protein n=1 Tax=Eptatretus burgeri TaxID=7764 RepID=A0A8C4R8T2_EPTBU